MHFGQGQVRRTVTRAKCGNDMVERGLVYCENSHCILVPTVCPTSVASSAWAASARLLGGGGDAGGGKLDMGAQIRSPSNSLPFEVSAVPEPGTWALWLLGLADVAAAARRR